MTTSGCGALEMSVILYEFLCSLRNDCFQLLRSVFVRSHFNELEHYICKVLPRCVMGYSMTRMHIIHVTVLDWELELGVVLAMGQGG